MAVMITVGTLAALLILGVGYGIHMYNDLVSERLKVENQWSQIDIVLKQRNDTIPNLVQIVQGYAIHEKELLEHVTQARSQYMKAGNGESAVRAAGNLSDVMSKFFAVAEGYPELTANRNFMELQNQYFDLERKAADFRQLYNDTAMRYNRLVLSFPSSMIAGIFHFQQKPFFEVQEDVSKSPEIRFEQ